MNDRHIYEGWKISDFIEALEPQFNMINQNSSWQKGFELYDDLKKWCKDNQPYYKKHIPEVYNYFKKKVKLL